MNSLKTPLEMFYHWESKTPELVFTRQALGNGQWEDRNWQVFAGRVRKIAQYILDLNLPNGSTIGLWAANNHEWLEVDLAIMMSGHISVPMFAGQDAETAQYIIEHSQISVLFCGAFEQADALPKLLTEATFIVGMSGFRGRADTTVAEIINTTPAFTGSPIPNPNQLFTIVYSSGTTGRPKGVMHSHGTPALVMPKIMELAQVDNLAYNSADRCRLISYLPLAHMAERVFLAMLGLYANAEIYFSSGPDQFAEEIRSVQPTFFFSVPRLWDRFKNAVEQQFNSPYTEPQRNAIKEQLGLAELKFALNASAPLTVSTGQWFRGLGIDIREGYGMTETFATGTTFSIEQKVIDGSAGYPTELIEAKISAAGEILLKAKGLMLGYFKNQEATQKTMEGDWYRTGDTGRIDEQGRLWVNGRVGSVFKTSKGKFVHPEAIEESFFQLPEIEQLIAFGHGRKQPCLIASLSEYGKNLNHEQLCERIKQQLEQFNNSCANHMRVDTIYLTKTEWSSASGLLTPTQKPKRQRILDHYQKEIQNQNSNQGFVILNH
ncbi:MAG: AMP-binding protein [Cellvibrionaceae bacterium]|nr:AMP-binding protein [Cellvibrionaceae bacterium]